MAPAEDDRIAPGPDLSGHRYRFPGVVHRAYTNLHSLGMEPLRLRAGWAVGGWFVPILNLVRPKQIMSDIWRGSDPAAPASNDGAWHRAPVPALLHLWWGLFLMSWLVDRLLVGSALLYEPTAQARRNTFVDNIAIRGVEVLLGIVAVLVVRQVTRRQEARAAGLAGDRQLR